MKSNESKIEDSTAQIVFKDKEIITRRPDNMSYEEYKILRKIQTTVLKVLFKKSPLARVSRLMSTKIGYNDHSYRKVNIPTPTNTPSSKINTPRKTA